MLTFKNKKHKIKLENFILKNEVLNKTENKNYQEELKN